MKIIIGINFRERKVNQSSVKAVMTLISQAKFSYIMKSFLPETKMNYYTKFVDATGNKKLTNKIFKSAIF